MAATAPPVISAEAAEPTSLIRRVASFPTRYMAPLPPPPMWNFRGRFTVFMGVASAISAVVAALAIALEPPQAPLIVALAFGLAGLLSTFYIVQVVPGGSLWTPADFLTFSSIFIIGPVGVIASAAGQASGYALRRRPGPIRVAFAFNSDMINGMIGWAVFQGAQNLHVPGGVFMAALLTGVAYETAGLLHIMLGASLGRRSFVGWSWLGELKFTLPFSVGYAWAALGAAQLFHRIGAVGITMVAVPVILFQGFLVYLARAVHTHQVEIEQNHLERVNLLRDLVIKQRTFVADASHELRTPLTTMSGGLEIMHQFPDIDVAMRQGLVDDALFETRRMTNLVDSLLVLAQLDDGDKVKRSPFAWNELMAAVVPEMEACCAPRAFTADISADLGEGFGDKKWLRELLMIIANNVAGYTPPEATATLSVHRDAEGTVSVVVTDDGPGVPADMVDRIFENFVQLDPSRNGSAPGLGLAIARSIATAHNGTIAAEELQPHGLRVTARIPSAADAPEQP